MLAFWNSKHPAMMLDRIVVLAFCGWWVVKNFASMQLPTNIEWPSTNFEQRSVELDSITSGGPLKDGIPSIDSPKFMAFTQAREFVLADEPEVSVSICDDHGAYPFSILHLACNTLRQRW